MHFRWRLAPIAVALVALIGAFDRTYAVEDSWDQESASFDSIPQEQVIVSGRILIPSGQSYWEVAFPLPVTLYPLRVYWVSEASCAGFSANVDVYDDTRRLWMATRYDRGVYQPPLATTSRLKVYLDQYSSTSTVCQVQVRTVVPPTPPQAPSPPPPPARTKVLVGVYDHDGGMVTNARVNLSQALVASQLEVYVPHHCINTEIFDAAVLADERRVQGTISGIRPVAVQLPQTVLFQAVELGILGPVGKACEIPIFAYALPSRLGDGDETTTTTAIPTQFDRHTFEAAPMSRR